MPVTAASAVLPKGKDGTRPALPTAMVAGESVGRSMERLVWTMPQDLPEGWYRAEFTGSALVPPFEWVSECEFEPYRFRLGTAPRGESALTTWLKFAASRAKSPMPSGTGGNV